MQWQERRCRSSCRPASRGRAAALALVVLWTAPAAAASLGSDPHRQPLACAIDDAGAALAPAPAAPPPPPDTQAWETIPGVVRSDGSETFRVEVEVTVAPAAVTLTDLTPCLEPLAEPAGELHDDGRGADQVRGDLVYTSVPLRVVPGCGLGSFFGGDAASPAGLALLEVGEISILEAGGAVHGFLARPTVGLLRADIAPAPAVALTSDVVATAHLVNVSTLGRETQAFLRARGDGLARLTTAVLAVLPDAFDFFVFFSTHRFEQLPVGSARNFVAGSYRQVRVNCTGTGVAPFDDGATYGSAARLLGVSALDAYGRGLLSKVATHELLHQWVAYLAPGFGLAAPDGIHFNPRSGAGSLVGGFRWLFEPEQGFILDCGEGASGAHRAPPLDRYMMGLIDGAEVPPLHAYAETSPSPVLRCGQVIDDVVRTVTIEDIQAVHGVRTPGPLEAQRDFAIAFVAESHARLLTPTELTFYDVLAAHYTAAVAPDAPDPYHGSAEWAPVTRFFGEGVRWRSDVLVCGNGRAEGPEECDDGNRAAGDGCSADCRREISDLPLEVEVRGLACINRHSSRRFRIGLLADARFDATTLDTGSVRLGQGAAPTAARLRDLDRDGDLDVQLRFLGATVGVACGERAMRLTGRTRRGQGIEALVPLRVLGCPPLRRGAPGGRPPSGT